MNNELIQQFSKKSTIYAETKASNVYSAEYFEYYNAKFAELLITECANICSNFKYTEEGPSESAAYQRSLCKFAIKEHFGLDSPGPLSPKVIR